MQAMATAGMLFPGAGGAPPVTRTASCPLRTAAAPSRVRLPSATAAAPARAVRLRSAARPTALRCAPTGNHTTGLDGVTEVDVAGLPSWVPTIEELIEFENTDFSPEAIHERFLCESKEAAAAVKGAAAGLLFRPLWELFDDVRRLKTAYDVEEFHIGLPIGALMACGALHRLCKAAPSAFVDFVLSYAFYRLCIIAADVRRRGFAPDMIIRIKLFVTMAILAKGLIDQVAFHNWVARFALFAMYFFSVRFEVKGLKKYGKYLLPSIFDPIKIPEERQGCPDTLSEIDFAIDEDN